MKIHFLGTAGAIASKDRDNTALLIELDGNLILIDCPGSVIQKIQKLGLDPNSIADVIITHDHTDHIYGLPSLIHSLWLMNRKSCLNIRATENVLKTCSNLVDTLALRTKKNMFTVNFIPFKDGDCVIEKDSLRIFVFEVSHSEGSVGVCLCCGDKKVVYSSDTEPCGNVEKHAFEANVLIHECGNSSLGHQQGHSNPEEVANLALKCRVKQLYLVHLPSEFIADPSIAVERVKKIFKDTVVIPSDLESISISMCSIKNLALNVPLDSHDPLRSDSYHQKR